MNKKRLIGVFLVLLLIVGYLVFEQTRKTTYEEVISKLIKEDEFVERITVYTQLSLLGKSATVMIEDQKMIDNILNKEIKLKKDISFIDEPTIHDNALLIETNKDIYQIGFDLVSVTIDSVKYHTINPSVNPIYMYILEGNLEWGITENIETPPH